MFGTHVSNGNEQAQGVVQVCGSAVRPYPEPLPSLEAARLAALSPLALTSVSTKLSSRSDAKPPPPPVIFDDVPITPDDWTRKWQKEE